MAVYSPDWRPAVAVQVGLVLGVEGAQLFGVLVTHMVVVGGHAGEAPLHQLVCIVHLCPTHHGGENLFTTPPNKLINCNPTLYFQITRRHYCINTKVCVNEMLRQVSFS